MEIRKATESDVKEISELIANTVMEINSKYYKQEVIDFWLRNNTPDKIKERIGDYHKDVFVLSVEDEIVGYLSVNINDSKLGSLYIKSSKIGKGYGKMLLLYAEEFAKENNVKILELDSSINAVDFYESQGYVVIKKYIKAVDGIKNPKIIMNKVLK